MTATGYLTAQEGADYLGVSRPTFDKAVRSGEIASTRIGERVVVKAEWIDDYINGYKVSLVDISARLTRVEVRLDSLDARLDKIEAGIAVVSRHLSALTRVAV